MLFPTTPIARRANVLTQLKALKMVICNWPDKSRSVDEFTVTGRSGITLHNRAQLLGNLNKIRRGLGKIISSLYMELIWSIMVQHYFIFATAASMIYCPLITLPRRRYFSDRVRSKRHGTKDNGKRWTGFCSRKINFVALLSYQFAWTLTEWTDELKIL